MPEVPRWHHSAEVPDGHRFLVNYGVILWDGLFGTYYLPEARRVMVIVSESALRRVRKALVAGSEYELENHSPGQACLMCLWNVRVALEAERPVLEKRRTW